MNRLQDNTLDVLHDDQVMGSDPYLESRAETARLVRYDVVSVGGADHAVITLESESNRNALSAQLLNELATALDHANNENVRSVLLQAAGPAFCSGADLNEAFEFGMEKSARDLARVIRAILAHPKPVIARVHGAVRAGGLGLVAAADIVIADEAVTYAFTEARLGLSPAVISLSVLPKMAPRGAGLTFLQAAPFDNDFASANGLISSSVPRDDLDSAVSSVLHDLAQAEPQGLRASKEVLNIAALQYFDEWSDAMIRMSAEAFGSEVARAHLSRYAR